MNKLFLLVIMLFLFFFQYNSNAQWIQIAQLSSLNGSVFSIAGDGNYIFAGVGIGNNSSDGIYRSTNNGVNWIKITSKPTCDIAILGTNILSCAFTSHPNSDSGVFRSTNNGINWIKVLNIYSNKIIVSGTNLYVGGRGIYISTNSGINWFSIGNGLNSQMIETIIVMGAYIFAGTKNYNGIYRTSNNGLNWTQVNNGLTSLYINDFSVIGTNLFVGTPQGVFKTTNYGNNWVSVNNGLNTYVWRLASYETNLFAASSTGDGVFFSKNYGANWIQKNQGLPPYCEICSFEFLNNYVFVGFGINPSIWRRSYSEIIGINKISSNISNKYSLSQNFPNPFNPSTSIQYEIPRYGFVKLIIYDFLGREIEIVVNEKQNMGKYEVIFEPKQYSSGIYFYKLESEEFSETKKMILLK